MTETREELEKQLKEIGSLEDIKERADNISFESNTERFNYIKMHYYLKCDIEKKLNGTWDGITTKQECDYENSKEDYVGHHFLAMYFEDIQTKQPEIEITSRDWHKWQIHFFDEIAVKMKVELDKAETGSDIDAMMFILLAEQGLDVKILSRFGN